MNPILEELSYRVADLERRVAGQFAFGHIKELSEDGTEARVTLSDGIDTDFIPVMVPRAGKEGKELWRYEVGEQVFVATPSGDPNQGVILGALFMQDRIPKDQTAARITQYEGGLQFSYNQKENVLTLSFKPSGDAKIILDAPSAAIQVNAKTARIEATETAVINTKEARVEASENVAVEGKKVTVNKNKAAGVVTGQCLCAFTGQPHPDVSLTVLAGR